MCFSLGHHGQLSLSGAIVATGRPTGSLSHVAIHRISLAGWWQCLWKISSQLSWPMLGMVIVLSVGFCGIRVLRSVGSVGRAAIVPVCFCSILLQAARQLRRGSKGLRILHFCVIAWIMSLCGVSVERMWLQI